MAEITFKYQDGAFEYFEKDAQSPFVRVASIIKEALDELFEGEELSWNFLSGGAHEEVESRLRRLDELIDELVIRTILDELVHQASLGEPVFSLDESPRQFFMYLRNRAGIQGSFIVPALFLLHDLRLSCCDNESLAQYPGQPSLDRIFPNPAEREFFVRIANWLERHFHEAEFLELIEAEATSALRSHVLLIDRSKQAVRLVDRSETQPKAGNSLLRKEGPEFEPLHKNIYIDQ